MSEVRAGAPKGVPGPPRPARWAAIPVADYLAALRVTRRRLFLEPAKPLRLPALQGALWHSVVGRALKALACTVPPGNCPGCPERARCIYATVMESHVRAGTEGPLATGARVPGPLIFDQGGWESRVVEGGQRFPLDYVLVGGHGVLPIIEQAVELAGAEGLGRSRVSVAVRRREARPGLAAALAGVGGSGAPAVALSLATPLRLKRRGTYLRRFDLEALARDVSFRVAALGHHHGGLPWPAPWAGAFEEARTASVVQERTRWVEGVRYSARQEREIVLGGLVGEVVVEGVGPELLALLAAASVLHAGKGASVGLGEIEVSLARA